MEGLDGKLDVAGAENCVAIWSSSNKKVLTVDNDGKFKALRNGTVTVTAKMGNVEVSQVVKVTSGWTGIW